MFLSPEDCSILQRILRCPVSGRSLVLADERQIAQLNARVLAGELAYFGVEPVEKPLEAAFITDDGALAYPLHQGVALMMPDYAIPLTDAGAQAITDSRIQRYETSVRSFYEELGWTRDADGHYEDARRWEDLRPVSAEYIRRCHLRLRQQLSPTGELLLDAASGPVQYAEYLSYSQAYKRRVCVDLSLAALKEAQKNLPQGHGLFVQANMLYMPFHDQVVDGFVSLHTVYHIHKDQQADVIKQLYRVLAPGRSGVIVYQWEKSGGLMRSVFAPFNLLRRVRGKLRRMLGRSASQPAAPAAERSFYRYFYSYNWFVQQGWPFSFSITSWRSVDLRFLRTFVWPWLGGRLLLRAIHAAENRWPQWMGRHGAYPAITIRKQPGP